jgi:hypothetical protein
LPSSISSPVLMIFLMCHTMTVRSRSKTVAICFSVSQSVFASIRTSACAVPSGAV